jgi:predicted GNAT family acetyltransferase
MNDTPVRVVDNAALGRFEAQVEGHTAFAEYRALEGTITFTHTVVPPALEGRGIGSALVRAGLQAARERGLKVIPRCRFFAQYMERHPETHDLLAPDGVP